MQFFHNFTWINIKESVDVFINYSDKSIILIQHMVFKTVETTKKRGMIASFVVSFGLIRNFITDSFRKMCPEGFRNISVIKITHFKILNKRTKVDDNLINLIFLIYS